MSVARVLSRAGLVVVRKEQVEQIKELTASLYVDKRKQSLNDRLSRLKSLVKDL